MLFFPFVPLLFALPAGGVASLGKLFECRQFVLVEPVVTIGTFDMDGGFGRTACIEREIEFPRHFSPLGNAL